MPKVLISCQKNDEEKIIHTLNVNSYKPKRFVNEEQVLLLLELYDCQMNLLLSIIHELSIHQDISISMCHEIPFYDSY